MVWMKHERKMVCCLYFCVCVVYKFFLSQAGHIIISLEPGDSGSEQHEQKQSWWARICLDQTTMEEKKSIPLCVRNTEQYMSYRPAQPVLLSYFPSNKV